ncbi:MAG: AAA family ATPase [Pseudomonadota bacterium]
MYLEHFRLKEEPFSIAPDPSFLYLSEGHREALAHLQYGFSHGGFVMITGEVGTGKTTLLRNLVKQTPEDLEVAFVLNPRLTVKELLETVCDELGIPYDPSENQSIKQYIDRLNEHLLATHRSGRSTVLIIDEAQNLSPAVLEQIRLLTNLETDNRKLLRIILLGQPELGELLARNELRQLAQRITARYHLGALSKEDSIAYICHRLSKAGGNPQLFTPAAMQRLYRISRGIPRLINVIADRSMLGTYVQGDVKVQAATVSYAAREVLGEPQQRWTWIAGGAIGVTSVLLLGAYLFDSPDTETTQPASATISGTIQRPAADTPPQQPAAQPASPGPQPAVQNPSPAVPVQVEVKRPAGTPFLIQRSAYSAVFARWGVNYTNTVNADIPCNFAPSAGLQCLARKGGWSDIDRLNLPVVLELWDDQPEPYYGAIVASADNRYRLNLGGEERWITPRELRDSWFGSFVVVWQTPPRYPGNLRSGDRHPTVEWLREQMIHLTALPLESNQSQRFGKDLEEAVVLFQEQEGLLADGIVGPETWIRIHQRLRLPGPALLS